DRLGAFAGQRPKDRAATACRVVEIDRRHGIVLMVCGVSFRRCPLTVGPLLLLTRAPWISSPRCPILHRLPFIVTTTKSGLPDKRDSWMFVTTDKSELSDNREMGDVC